MPLADLQRLAGLPGRITRMLVQAAAGARSGRCAASCGARRRAHRRRRRRPGRRRCCARRCDPSDQASALFATISGLLGLLFAFGALLLDGARAPPRDRRPAPDRRQAQRDRADAAVPGAVPRHRPPRSSGCWAAMRSRARVLPPIDRLPRRGVHARLAHARDGAAALLLALGAGVLATCVASAVPLLDLRRGARSTPCTASDGMPGQPLSPVVAAAGLGARGRAACWRARPCCSRPHPRWRCSPACCWRWRRCSLCR